jgi:DNA-binding MarR family transcriptional regulator
MSQEPKLILTTFLPYRLSILYAVVGKGFADLYEKRFGIGNFEWRVMATLGQYRSMTAKAIAEHAEMDKVQVSRAAGALETKAYISRCQNPDDRREEFLVLTRAGRRVYKSIIPLALTYVEQLKAGLTRDEQVTLDKLIDKVILRARELRRAS